MAHLIGSCEDLPQPLCSHQISCPSHEKQKTSYFNVIYARQSGPAAAFGGRVRSSPMLVDSTRNRIITRVCIALVATVCPLSLAFTLFTLFFHLELLKSWKDPRYVLFIWSLSESIFWLWSVTKYNLSLSPKSAKVVPSYEERQKLKEDCLWIIGSCLWGAAEFLEGWFSVGKQSARIEDLRQDNVKDW